MKTTTALPLLFFGFCLSFLVSLARSAAVDIDSRSTLDVFTPPITYPTAGVVWTVNETRTVTWDISGAPVNITNKIGRIQLRQAGLITSVVLAANFSILLGQIDVTVPWVLTDDNYSLVLFGDSGDVSPDFTITD